MTRCPLSLSRLVKVTSGQVVYKAEKDACRAFPDPKATVWRRAQAEFPDPFAAGVPGRVHAAHSAQGRHLIRYYGWYSNKARGLRRKVAAEAAAAASRPAPARPL